MAVDSVTSKTASPSASAQTTSSTDASKKESSGPATGDADKGKAEDSTYVVKSGDTLSEIARDHDVKLRELVEANPQIRDPNRIFTGQQITIPGGGALEASHATRGRGSERPTIAVEHGALSADTIQAQRVGARPGVQAPGAAAQANRGAPLGDIVESVYESELGRPSDPGGKANWVAYAQGLRNQGQTDEQIGNALESQFHQSEEYRAKHLPAANPSAPDAVPAARPASAQPSNVDPVIANKVAVSQRTPGTAGNFDVSQVVYQDPAKAGGNHNVYVRVLGADGKELPPADVEKYFTVQAMHGTNGPTPGSVKGAGENNGVARDAWTTGQNTGGSSKGYFDVPLNNGSDAVTVWVEPKQGVPNNPYAGFGSQQVGPFKMGDQATGHPNDHVNYLVTFQARAGGASAQPAAAPPVAAPAAVAPAAAAPAKSNAPLGDMVESVYQSELGRPSDEGGKAHWISVAQGWRNQGKTDQQIGAALAAEFHKSAEYQARHPSAANPAAPVATPAAPSTAAATSAPAPGNGQFVKPDGGVHNFVGGNYTDLGRLDDGNMPDPATAEGAQAIRNAAAADLDRLRGQGVDEVRIWAGNVPAGGQVGDLENPQAMAARVRIIAEEAAKRGMTVTVDLFDGNCVGDKNVDKYRAMDPKYDEIVRTVVGGNRDLKNIQWSVGNEIGDPNNPQRFADWYVEKANLIHQVGGPGSKVITEFTPGSAINHPRYIGNDPWEQAARKIIGASDIVGIHFYPKTGPGNLDTADQLEYETFSRWNDLARQAGKPFVVGEFNVSSEKGGRSSESIQQWLQRFDEMGADHVSLWQFMKNEAGHIDEESFDSLRGRDFIDQLRRDGWLDRKPRNNGI